MSAASPRVVVVGGGVIGCAIAWRLSREAVAVTVLERARTGGGASSAAAGMLSPLKEAEEPGPFLDLGVRSLERYPAFVRELEAEAGLSVDYRRDGRLDVALSDSDAERLRSQHRLQDVAGHESRLLDPSEIRRLEPQLTGSVRLGLATSFDHQIDNLRLLRALRTAAEQRGVEIREGAAVAAVELDPTGSSVSGVRLDSGAVVRADIVVLAAGAWAGGIDLPRPLPIRPVRGQIVVLRMDRPMLGRVVWGPDCYLVPRNDGRILIGATMEEAGFAATTTADAIRRLLDGALRLAPGLGDAAIDGFQVGLRPATPDGRPILGPEPEVAGLFHAAGHFRNGVLLAPETAELLKAAILDGVPVDPAFSPARF